jgi:hypothetical protein
MGPIEPEFVGLGRRIAGQPVGDAETGHGFGFYGEGAGQELEIPDKDDVGSEAGHDAAKTVEVISFIAAAGQKKLERRARSAAVDRLQAEQAVDRDGTGGVNVLWLAVAGENGNLMAAPVEHYGDVTTELLVATLLTGRVVVG